MKNQDLLWSPSTHPTESGPIFNAHPITSTNPYSATPTDLKKYQKPRKVQLACRPLYRVRTFISPPPNNNTPSAFSHNTSPELLRQHCIWPGHLPSREDPAHLSWLWLGRKGRVKFDIEYSELHLRSRGYLLPILVGVLAS